MGQPSRPRGAGGGPARSDGAGVSARCGQRVARAAGRRNHLPTYGHYRAREQPPDAAQCRPAFFRRRSDALVRRGAHCRRAVCRGPRRPSAGGARISRPAAGASSQLPTASRRAFPLACAEAAGTQPSTRLGGLPAAGPARSARQRGVPPQLSPGSDGTDQDLLVFGPHRSDQLSRPRARSRTTSLCAQRLDSPRRRAQSADWRVPEVSRSCGRVAHRGAQHVPGDGGQRLAATTIRL